MAAGVVFALAAGAPVGAQDLQQKLAAAKQSAAQNQQALRSYACIEKVELSLKSEVKNTTANSCRYEPDGKVQKTAVVEPPPPEKKRGLRGKIVEKKTGEMKASSKRRRPRPPIRSARPEQDAGVMNAETASLAQAKPGVVVLKFPGYEKAGDSLSLTFDSTVKALRQIDVASYLDDSQSPVTLRVALAGSAGRVNHPGSVVLRMPARNIEVRITNSNYQKLAP